MQQWKEHFTTDPADAAVELNLLSEDDPERGRAIVLAIRSDNIIEFGD